MIIIKAILLIVFLAVAYSAMTLLSAWRRVKETINGFARQTRHQHTTADGNVVVDRRTEAQINKKIIPEGEGEYVDFTETE